MTTEALSKWIDICEYPFAELYMGTTPIAFDTETVGYTNETNIPFYFSYSFIDSNGKRHDGAGPVLTEKGQKFVQEICQGTHGRSRIMHNCKFDLKAMHYLGLPVHLRNESAIDIDDTCLMHTLIDEHGLHGLKILPALLLRRPRIDALEDWWKQKRVAKERRNNLIVPQDLMHQYAIEDAVDTLDLYNVMLPQLKGEQTYDLYREYMRVEVAYLAMEIKGIRADEAALDKTIPAVQSVMEMLKAKIYTSFGCTFNLSASSPEFGNTLKKHFNIKEQTESGRWKADAATRAQFRDDPKMQLVNTYCFLRQACSMIVGYKKRMQEGSRLHTKYDQRKRTGRTSSSDPCLMNIPKQQGRISEIEVGDAELAEQCAATYRLVRATFVADEGALLWNRDYKQGEYKIFAYYTGSERLISALRRGEDFHDLTSKLVFGEVTKRLRHIVKIINYGRIYGMGNPLLEATIHQGDPTLDPKEVRERYDRLLPEMGETQVKMIELAERRGYLIDPFNRRYRYQRERPYAIVSWICQGTLANVKKIALTRVHRGLQDRQSYLCLDIHDQLTMNIFPEPAVLVRGGLLDCIQYEMEDFPQFNGIPLDTDQTIGFNLLEQHTVTNGQIQYLLRLLHEGTLRKENIKEKIKEYVTIC